MTRARETSGQTVVEFLLALGVALIGVAGFARLWKAQWDRSRCAYLAFEATHAARAGRAGPSSPFGTTVRITSDADDFHGVAECGAARESVTLPRLESVRKAGG